MKNDDRPVGRILSRRQALALLGAAGAALLAACTGLMDESTTAGGPAATASGQVEPTRTAITGHPATDAPDAIPANTTTAATDSGETLATAETTAAPAAGQAGATALPLCVARPEQTEGPYFVDEMLLRSDIRSDPSDGSVRVGLPLELTLVVSQVSSQGCTALAGATVDIWHCDALGVYSDVNDRAGSTVGQKFLRGTQISADDGAVHFTTIYPGWYQGRAVHIHFKIRTAPESATGHEFTSQLYFDDALSEQVFAQPAYAAKGQGFTRNEQDGLFRNGGDQLLLDLTSADQGYTATFSVGLQLD